MTPLHTVIFLGLVVWARCTIVSALKDVNKTDTTITPINQKAERRMSMDEEDSSVDSSNGMSSYSSVVIHHPVATSHTGQQTMSQWTIEDHKTSGFQRSSDVEPQVHHNGRRHNRHYARSGATASTNFRDDVTTRPETESLSTAQTFFRLRGYKGRTQANKEENPSNQEESSFKYDDSTSSNHYSQSNTKGGKKQSIPPGMTHDLMNALLSQQPQTFDYGYKSSSRSDDDDNDTNKKIHDSHTRSPQSTRPSRKPQKKYKNQVQSEGTEKSKKRANNKNRDSFNVGYSIGFGSPTASTVTENPIVHHGPNDVVLGKPKSHRSHSNYKLHVNGENSVWKEIHPGVEMSEDQVKNTPLSLSIPEKSQYYQDEPEIGLLSGHPGQSVYYINNVPQDYNVPTTGQATFDHAHALGQSNTFDFSNAVSHPLSPHQVHTPQNKQDTHHNIKTPKHIQSIQFSKPTSYQNYQSSDNPKKSVSTFSNQPYAYVPYSLDLNKQSPQGASQSSSDFSQSTSQHIMKPSKNQPSLTSNNLAGGYDLSHFMGFGTPVPVQNVFIPGKKDGEGEMVPAIVIPISQLSGFENFGSGLNYASEANDGFQPFGGDVFNVMPQSPQKESHKTQISGKYNTGKLHTPRINDNNKPLRAGKGGYLGIKSLINLSAPEHLDSPRKPHPNSKHPRSDSLRQYSGPPHKVMAPKFSQVDQFRDSPANLKRSPSNRSARLAQLQSELNSILAEEMYRKNRSNRRHIVAPPHLRMY